MEKQDVELIKKIFRGDEQSLEFLIKRYLKPVYNFIYQYVGNVADTEDIAQETFVRVWRHLKKFDLDKNFKTWLFSIAKNAAIDWLRKKRPIPLSAWESEDEDRAAAEIFVDPAPLPDEIFDRQHLTQSIQAALAQLSADYRAVVFLHYQEGLTFREIAEILGEPLDTVKSRERRALLALRKILIQSQ